MAPTHTISAHLGKELYRSLFFSSSSNSGTAHFEPPRYNTSSSAVTRVPASGAALRTLRGVGGEDPHLGRDEHRPSSSLSAPRDTLDGLRSRRMS